jgi:hypothetical protein
MICCELEFLCTSAMAAADKTTEKDPFQLDWSGIVEDFEESEKIAQKSRPHSFNIKTQANVHKCVIQGAVYLRDGDILITDNSNQSVKLFTNDGRLKDELASEMDPCGIAMLDDTTAAVTYHGFSRMQLISVEEKLFVQSDIELPFQPYSVCGYKGQLAVTCHEDGSLHIVTRGGNVTKTPRPALPGEHRESQKLFHSVGSVTCNQAGTVLYVLDTFADELFAVTEEGEIKFRYKHSKLRGVNGVSVDASGNVYVCGNGSRNVHQVTADGQHKSILPIIKIDYRVISYQPYTENFMLIDPRVDTILLTTLTNRISV